MQSVSSGLVSVALHMYCHALVLPDSFCETRSLSLPTVLSPLHDMDFVTIATESLSQYLQPLVTVSWIATPPPLFPPSISPGKST